ncbi:hypothetical protein VTN77DRAFT_3207 [Rasamsonia byssochlamydoides]|uniref:uncharacterized protein n=1 Tax=Rasamsonia byssochlamydoides TaxID=89139 RepID=UPI00374277D1
MATYTPLEAPLPPLPEADIFTELQWKTLLSLADTVIPSITSQDAAKSPNQKTISTAEMESALATLKDAIEGPDAGNLAGQYLEENASSIPQFKESLHRILGQYVPQEGKNGLGFILTALNTRAGSLLLTGSATPIQDQPFDVREKIFQNWKTSRLAPLRVVYRALTLLFKKTWISLSPTICPVLGFPRVPVHGKPADGFDFQFLQFPPGEQPETVETDVVIVGSGCGGAVAAKNLAEAGHRVLVVEKSYHYPSKYFPMTQAHGPIHLFENGGACASDDGCMAVLAGSTWGGGGTINWSASLQTQSYVREEWADSGLPFFTSSEFQKSLDRVCERMGVNTESIKHNSGNQVILEGARKLGYSANTVPQNTANREHYCGYCTLGCASVTKQGPVATWLVDAANAGAVFIEGFHVDKVLFDTVDGGKVASGVEGVWTSRDTHLGTAGKDAVKRKVVIKAKRVIVSCGSLQSPLLLMRSGIKNPHLGRHLHLHPVLLAAAVFDKDIRPWEGACLTTVVNQFENLDGHGHGPKIEATTMIPVLYLSTFPWKDGFQYKMWASKLRHMTSFITLTRDRDTGRVYPDPVDGRLRIDYTVSPFDRNHMVEGLIAAAKIAYISGAKEFHTTYGDMPPFIRPAAVEDLEGHDEGVNNAALQAWIKELRRKAPLNPERGVFASAHQMGTCRMADSPKKGVVAPDGHVWGTRGLYVVDASVFPSASGVNPMVTNMAISDWTSRNIAKGLNRENVSKTARL